MSLTWIRILFVFAGIYDGLLGLAFLTVPRRLFAWADVPPPNHLGYVEFPALLLIVFALLFFQVARAPVRKRGLIPYGCGLKLAYCGTVFAHQAAGDIPSIWLPWAWADLLLFLLFVAAWRTLGRSGGVPA